MYIFNKVMQEKKLESKVLCHKNMNGKSIHSKAIINDKKRNLLQKFLMHLLDSIVYGIFYIQKKKRNESA